MKVKYFCFKLLNSQESPEEAINDFLEKNDGIKNINIFPIATIPGPATNPRETTSHILVVYDPMDKWEIEQKQWEREQREKERNKIEKILD